MAVGGSDRADAGAWVQSARSSAAPPGRDATASDRTSTQSRARFGEALSVARSRDTTASRATATRGPARAAPGDTHTGIARRETAAERSDGDAPPASRHADDVPAKSGIKAAPPAKDAVRGERPDAATPCDPGQSQPVPGAAAGASEAVTTPDDTSKAADTAKDEAKADGAKADEAKAAKPAIDPNAAATGQAAATAPPQPGLVAPWPASAGGGAVAAGPDGAQVQSATGAVAASPDGATTAATGSAIPATDGAGGAPQAGAEPASLTAGTTGTEAVPAKTQADAPGEAAEPDFLSMLADSSQDAGRSAAGPSPVAAAPASAAPGATHTAPSTAPAAQAAAASQAAPAVRIGQVPMTIGLRSLQGSSEFQIRLDPAELGRIEVKLEIDKARGTVMTHLVVDRPETLLMLQRDAGQLQQALSQAGLDASGGVGVSLRGDDGARNRSQGEGGNRSRGGGAWTAEMPDAAQEAAPVRALRGYGGLDIRI